MKRVVMKFGGSSVATIEKIKKVAEILKRRKNGMNDIVCVVSAMGDTTDELLSLAGALSKNPSRRELDMLLATGEMVSASLLAIALNKIGEKAIALNGAQAGFEVKGRYGFAKVVDVNTSRIERELSEENIVIVTGFQGINSKEDFSTLGRGGSDTSAVAIASKLGVDCEIYTDVDGIYTVDPRFHRKAKKLSNVSYDEAMEMAHLGAKIIDPRSVEIAKKYGIRIYVALNSANVLGTYIGEENVEESVISNLSVQDNILLVKKTLKNESIAELFLNLAKEDVNIDIISKMDTEGKTLVRFTSVVGERDLIEKVADDFEFVENVSKVSIIGNAMRNQPGVAARVFDLLNSNGINFHGLSTSEISISIIVDTLVKEKVMSLLIREFEL